MKTPKELILETMRGERQGKRPVFVPYANFVKEGPELNTLLKRGMGICQRPQMYEILYPNIKFSTEVTNDGEYTSHRTTVVTPKGNLYFTYKENEITSYISEHMVKDVDDLPAYKAMLEDAIVRPNYKAVYEALKGADYNFVRSYIAYEPLQEIIVQAMGLENFCYAWIEDRDAIMECYKLMNEINRKIYTIAADCPVDCINYGGNVVPSLIGRDTFEELYLPCYAEAAEIIHRKNKLLGCHFDADNTLILDLIGKSKLDYVEAYDISCSAPLSEAIKNAPDKIFWLNFPSSVHTMSSEVIYNTTIQLLEEGKKAKGLVMGVTEDIPWQHWVRSYTTIMNAIDDYYGKL